jgi:hypothetical protein
VFACCPHKTRTERKFPPLKYNTPVLFFSPIERDTPVAEMSSVFSNTINFHDAVSLVNSTVEQRPQHHRNQSVPHTFDNAATSMYPTRSVHLPSMTTHEQQQCHYAFQTQPPQQQQQQFHLTQAALSHPQVADGFQSAGRNSDIGGGGVFYVRHTHPAPTTVVHHYQPPTQQHHDGGLLSTTLYPIAQQPAALMLPQQQQQAPLYHPQQQHHQCQYAVFISPAANSVNSDRHQHGPQASYYPPPPQPQLCPPYHYAALQPAPPPPPVATYVYRLSSPPFQPSSSTPNVGPLADGGHHHNHQEQQYPTQPAHLCASSYVANSSPFMTASGVATASDGALVGFSFATSQQSDQHMVVTPTHREQQGACHATAPALHVPPEKQSTHHPPHQSNTSALTSPQVAAGLKTCHLCHQAGHYARMCTNTITQTMLVVPLTCYRCQKDGHVAKRCPLKGTT